MPRLSVNGKAAMGQAGGVPALSVDGAIPAALASANGGGWAFLDTAGTTLIGQSNSGSGYRLNQLVLPNTLSNVDAFGANTVAAGGGKYQAFLVGSGVRSNAGGAYPLATAVLGSVDDDGASVVVTNYQTGSGLSVYSASGVLLKQIDTIVTGRQFWISLRGGYLTWPSSTGWPLVVAATGQPYQNGPNAPYKPRQNVRQMIIVKNTIRPEVPFLVENDLTTNAWTIRRFDLEDGLLINSQGTEVWNPDARMVSGLVRFAWATNNGETPTSLITLDINTATGATTKGVVSGGGMVYSAGPTLTGQTFDMATAPTTSLPWNSVPVVDSNRLMTAPWRTALENTNTNVTQVTTQVNNIPAQVNYGIAEVVTHGDPSPFPAGRRLLDSATVTADWSVPGEVRLNVAATVLSGGGFGAGMDGQDGMTIPGPPGQPGRDGISMPGLPGEDGESAVIFLSSASTSTGSSTSYVPVSTGAEPLEIMSNGAGSVLLVPFTP